MPKNNVVRLARIEREDGWINFLTGLGMLGKDKRLGGTHQFQGIDEFTAEDLWRGDDMAARIIETAPGEMLREGFCITIQDTEPAEEQTSPNLNADSAKRRRRRGDDSTTALALPEQAKASKAMNARQAAEAIDAQMDDLNVVQTLIEAMCTERGVGGAALLIGADDGAADWSKPLNLATIRSVDYLTVLAPRECLPARWYQNPRQPKFGQPEIYTVQQDPEGGSMSMAARVHESRIIRFPGVRVSRRAVRSNRGGWGDSILCRVLPVLRDFQTSWQGAGVLLHDFAQSVWKIKGLAELLAADDGTESALTRAKVLEMGRSIVNGILIDSEEEWERKATPLTGYPEMLQQFSLRLAAAARMPVTLLMGQSPVGLQATGASDIRFFYDSISREREMKLRPKLNRIVRLLMLAKSGPTRGVEPSNWKVSFPPLWQLSELEQADLRQKQSLTDKAYVDAGVLVPEEVAINRFGGDEYSTQTKLESRIRMAFDDSENAAARAEAEAAKAEAKAALQAGPKQMPPNTPPPPAKP